MGGCGGEVLDLSVERTPLHGVTARGSRNRLSLTAEANGTPRNWHTPSRSTPSMFPDAISVLGPLMALPQGRLQLDDLPVAARTHRHAALATFSTLVRILQMDTGDEHVHGWDDPNRPTTASHRRFPFPPRCRTGPSFRRRPKGHRSRLETETRL
jgi:hypothetical protein